MNIITELCKLQVTTEDVDVADAFMGVDVTVNGVPAESASGTLEMSSASGYCIVLDAYINGVHYTGTSTNPVV